MLKEQVAEIIWEYKEPLKSQVVSKILNLFKAEVDKLTVIDDEEKIKITDELCKEYKIRWADFEKLSKHDMEQFVIKVYDNTSEAQLQTDKDKLLDLMGE